MQTNNLQEFQDKFMENLEVELENYSKSESIKTNEIRDDKSNE